MGLSPEERKRVYEEEKAKAEAGKPEESAESDIKELKPNIAGLLCYVAGWISGIILLVLEKKNQFVRFHAMQSVVTFGALTITQIIFMFIPFVGWILNSLVWALILILWVVLMYRAYQGQRYKLAIAGDIADKLL